MLQSPILPLQLPHTHTMDCGGWPQELRSRCQGLQMSAAESYRQWRGRKAPTLPSGGISRSHRGPDAVWHLGGRCSIRTHYINCWTAFGSSRSSSRSYTLRFSEQLRVEEISPFGCAEALHGLRESIFRHLSNCEQSPIGPPLYSVTRCEGTIRPTVVLFLWWRSRIFVYRKSLAHPLAAPHLLF